MDMIARLKKILKNGDVSFDELVEAGLVRVYDTDQELFRGRLLEFQSQYGLHSFDFYQAYQQMIPNAGEGVTGLVSGDDADEWAWLYEQYVDEGGDPFTLPFQPTESSHLVGRDPDGCYDEGRGRKAPAFLVRSISPVSCQC